MKILRSSFRQTPAAFGALWNRRAFSNCVPRGALPAVIATILLSSLTAKSEPVATYNFAGGSLASTVSSSSYTASNISGGITGNRSLGGNFFRIDANFVGSSQPDAFNNGKYISFTIVPANGVHLAFTGLSYEQSVDNNLSSDVQGTIEYRWSLDSFAAPIGSNTLVASGGQLRSERLNILFPGPLAARWSFALTFLPAQIHPMLRSNSTLSSSTPMLFLSPSLVLSDCCCSAVDSSPFVHPYARCGGLARLSGLL